MAVRVAFGRACLDTRLALDVSREEVGRRVGVTGRYIGMIERGDANPTLALAERIGEALGLELDLLVRPPIFPGGRHVRDRVHARCSAYSGRRLGVLHWEVAREVEIVHGRSHGWIDLLAFDPRSGTLLVIEIKTRLDDLGALERQLGWYERMAWQAARARGWRPRRIVACVLALASDEVETVVRVHRDLFRTDFPVGARDLARVTADPGARVVGRGFALIDPASRRRDWLLPTSIDGRRSRLPYRDDAAAARASG